MNNKLFALFSFTFLLSSLSAQYRVEGVKDDKSAIRFIKNTLYDDNTYDWDKFHLIKGDEWKGMYNISKQLEDSLQKNLKYVGWVKTDLNNDKREDLVVSGYFEDKDNPEREYGVFIFQSDKKVPYTVQNLKSSDLKTFPLYIAELIFHDKKLPMIRLVDWAPDAIKNSTLPFAQDTVFSFDKYYINFNSHPLGEWVNAIQFNIKNKDRIHTKLSITNLDSASIGVINLSFFYSNKWHDIKGKIYPDIYEGLDQLVNYCLSPLDLENNLTGNYMDQDYLNIKFLNGKEVSLSNFTARNRYTFDAIRTWLFDLNAYVNYLHSKHGKNNNKK